MEIDELRSRLGACAQRFDETPKYAAPDRVVGDAFQRHPRNDALDAVLLKVALVDRLYSTYLIGTDAPYLMATHIVRNDLDSHLDSDQTDAVEIIRSGHGIRGGRDYFSFATKYCHWHKPDVFPMYDGNVRRAINWLNTSLRLGDLPEEHPRVFVLFKDLVDAYRSRLRLDWSGYKRFDQALWILGIELDSKRK